MPQAFLTSIKRAGIAWQKDHASYLAAAIAYHAIFSLAPLLIVMLAVAGWLYGGEASHQALSSVLQGFVGNDATKVIEDLLQKSAASSQGQFAVIFGGILTLVGSIGVFSQLRQAVNLIWGVEPPKSSIKTWLKRQAGLFVLVISASILFVASVTTTALLERLGGWLAFHFMIPETVLGATHFITAFAIVTGLFALLFKALPETRVPWKTVWFPAFFTAVLFTIGKYLIGLYLARGSVQSVYGAAGSFAGLLIWMFYAAQIFLYGIELTKVRQPS